VAASDTTARHTAACSNRVHCSARGPCSDVRENTTSTMASNSGWVGIGGYVGWDLADADFFRCALVVFKNPFKNAPD
jgi:hypothetical protein